MVGIYAGRIIVVIALICGLNVFALSQKGTSTPPNPDLTGTWEIADKKSKSLRQHKLVITQLNDELVLEERLEYEKEVVTNKLTLYTDGRGESNVINTRDRDVRLDVTSKTVWKDGKLTRKMTYDSPMEIQGRRTISKHTDTETYSLSKDGTELTIRVVSRKETSFGTMPLTYSGQRTYRKQT